ncbi:MAG TPA: ABC transporter ATP-binding protein [Dictyoglomaceae bacterium]|nr:ABC transporter ATP-binding protein [Dictyoglomaceae bacterium]HOL39942.1 ABC transporter ATP-binding protein [Dictyoglomaceae bacterium]HOP95669.1 ABC transporter ATP-binding protein [Dictyoglomaceae bacterium]HPP16404.1 ABC transporter ATP-binding protein [Dictyoglomaceae bacterium]HPU43629.1 ABC transporter ATP-binding protein [Dictyoglomaceae bacterium]
MIHIENLYKYYISGKEKYLALKDINLKIEKGEFVAIIGPSGSGKSTLLNIIGGLDRPSSGKVFIDGEDIFKFDDERLSKYRNKRIGYIFQSFYLEPSYTVFENVMIPLIFSGDGRREEKVKKALEKVGLSHKLRSKPTELSGGERQRVAIARAIVNDPDILLCDEPTGNLDSQTGLSIMNLLKDLNEEGKTILLVTHNLEYANMSSRILKIRDGEIKED